MHKKQTGFARIFYATNYSLRGLKAAFFSEPAVRQEVAALSILIPLALYLEVENTEKLWLIFSLVLILITELLNTAIEKLADHVTTDIHLLIGKAKDIGSAAVFVSILLAMLTWGVILI
ncbi:diacylglycerol kinase [Alteromonas sp. 345S023]|uniref:Diacylglycerol kinase n=1 Tax=Alteromonas profundi TaxID=2696062 RepID=A0A7X5LKZ0_9ALTE|nr:diacylglycerol kinase [Alteromonas profundi]NDV91251.1 diacylglycerol kinase [Alteromonas profundi]